MKLLESQQGKRCDEAEYLTYTHRRCTQCGEVKALTLFYRKATRTARGWAWDSICIGCRRAGCREYGKTSKDLRNKRLRAWRKANPVAAKAIDRRRRLKQKFGITEEDVARMRDEQDGRCAICGRPTPKLLVDHCHTKGHVRGLLCQTCNTFLGWYEKKADTILQFQAYLDRTG